MGGGTSARVLTHACTHVQQGADAVALMLLMHISCYIISYYIILCSIVCVILYHITLHYITLYEAVDAAGATTALFVSEQFIHATIIYLSI